MIARNEHMASATARLRLVSGLARAVVLGVVAAAGHAASARTLSAGRGGQHAYDCDECNRRRGPHAPTL
jgi:hypothetical protein